LAVAVPLAGQLSLECLHLSHNPLRGEGIAAIGKALQKNTALRVLAVAACNIGSRGFCDFCDALVHNETLTSLNVARNPILDEGAVRLASLIEDRGLLKTLGLEQCDITEPGGDALFRAFAQSPAIRRVSLCNNLIRNAPLIQQTVLASPQLCHLDLNYNTLDYRVTFELQRMIAENRRALRRAREKRVAGAFRERAEISGRLRETRARLLEEREALTGLQAQIAELGDAAESTRMHRDHHVGQLQQRLTESIAAATALADDCRERMMRMRAVLDRLEAEVAALTQALDGRNAQFSRECKTLAVAEERITALVRMREFLQDDFVRKKSLVRLKYADARDLFEKRWKAARAKKRREDGESPQASEKKGGRGASPKRTEEGGARAATAMKKRRSAEDSRVSGDAPTPARPASVLAKAPKIVRPLSKKAKGQLDIPQLAKVQLPPGS
jgi:hypothetical protein